MSEGPQTRKRLGIGRRRHRHLSLNLAAAAALSAVIGFGGVVPRAHAADGTWNGSTGDTLWQTPANWDSDIVPGNNSGAAGTSTDTATFLTNPPPPVTDPPTTWALVGVDPDRNIKNLTFASTTITFRIGTNTFNDGNALYLSGGGVAQATGNTIGINSDIHAPVQFTGSTYRFLNDSLANATLRFQGNITAAPGGTTLTLDGAHGSQSSSQTELNGALLDNPGGGVLSIVKQGTGTWEVNADSTRPNTYSGDTIINGGILRSTTGSGTNGLGAFSPNSHYIVNNGGTLRNSTANTTMKKLTVNFGGVVNVSTAASTILNVKSESGPAVNLNFAANTNSNNITVNVPFSLTGTTPLEGGITLAATPGATGTGPVTISTTSGGLLNLGSVTRIIDVGKGSGIDSGTGGNSNYDLRISGTVSGTAGFIKTGPGTLRFNGTSANPNIPVSGNIEIREGTLNPSNANMFDNRPTLLVSGGTLHLQSDQLQTFAATTVTKGTLTGGNNNVSVAAPSFAFDVGAGDTARADVILADAGSPTSLNKSGAGTATIEIPPTYTGSTSVSGGTLSLAASSTNSSSISVSGGTLELRASDTDTNRVIKTGAVSITGSGRLDLTQNKLITTTPAGTATGGTYSGIQGEVQRASNFGAWDQPGLTTSKGDALAGLTTIGVATGEQVRGLGPTDTDTFAGQTITGATTIAMYTYAGDANLDGTIDGGDYGIIDNFAQIPGSDGYANGDFNYDSVIDGGDYGIIDNNAQAQGAPFPTSGSSAAGELAGVTAVPEPSALGLVILGGAALARGRRCRRQQSLQEFKTSGC